MNPVPLFFLALAPLDYRATNDHQLPAEWEVWVRGLENGLVEAQSEHWGPAYLRLDRDRDWYLSLLEMSQEEQYRLGVMLDGMLADPERFVAAHVALWSLYSCSARGRPNAGLKTVMGLELWWDGGKAGPGDLVVFPRPLVQSARLRAWWRGYALGRRDVFFVAGEDRPVYDNDFFLNSPHEQLEAYRHFLPPDPPGMAAMSPRELEAYYGAPPDVPADFDPDEAPPDFRPPPVANWRELAGLPSADAPRDGGGGDSAGGAGGR